MPKLFSIDAKRAKPVRLTTPTEEGKSRRLTVTGSQSLSDMGFTVHGDLAGLQIINRGTSDVNYSAVGGSANTSHAAIPPNGCYVVTMNSAKAAFLRLYSLTPVAIDVFESIVLQDSPFTTT